MDPWEILNTGAPFDIESLLGSPTSGGPLFVGGGDILVGADTDLATLLGITTSGGGDILTGAIGGELEELMTGAGRPNPQVAKLRAMLAAAAKRGQALGMRQGAAAMQQRQQAAAQPNLGVRATVTPETDARYALQPIGFDSETDILPGGSRLVKQQPQKRAKPKRITIFEPEFWRIKGVYVGNKPQFLAQGSVPGIAFAADAVAVELVGDTCQIGQDLIIDVENRTGANHRFEGVIFCHSVD